MAEWFSIEVFDGSSSARAWKAAYGGTAGVPDPRRPRPLAGAGAVSLPEPLELEVPTLAPYTLTPS